MHPSKSFPAFVCMKNCLHHGLLSFSFALTGHVIILNGHSSNRYVLIFHSLGKMLEIRAKWLPRHSAEGSDDFPCRIRIRAGVPRPD
jgi:hypothetical protein